MTTVAYTKLDKVINDINRYLDSNDFYIIVAARNEQQSFTVLYQSTELCKFYASDFEELTEMNLFSIIADAFTRNYAYLISAYDYLSSFNSTKGLH